MTTEELCKLIDGIQKSMEAQLEHLRNLRQSLFGEDRAECDDCGVTWPIATLKRYPLTGEHLCPDCCQKAWI